MGRNKALLPVGPGEVMLQRVVRLVGEVVPADRIVCVAAPEQKLPNLPADVRVVRDPVPHQGPLAGLATGLVALQDLADAVFVCGCDAPRLAPAVVARLFELVGDFEVAAPHDGERWHPLAAVYRVDLRPQIETQLAAGERSLQQLLERCHTRRVPPDELRYIDPHLDSLAQCNTPDDYERLLQRGD